jgi:adenylate cyclase
LKGLHRKLVAILSADVVGYSRLMANDEIDTIRRITAYRRKLREVVEAHDGRVVDDPGDNVLAEHPTATDAVRCAVAIQQVAAAQNADIPADRRMELRIGVNLAEIATEGGRIYGDGVNIAARLEALAEPGGICISEVVHTQVRNKLDLAFRDLGEHQVKNIPTPVRTYGLGPGNTRTDRRDPPATAQRLAPAIPPRPGIRSLAILPFVNLSGDETQDYFADGLTMDIQTALVKISGLHLIGEGSTFTYKSRPLTIEQLSEELAVEYLLEGCVRRVGDRVRISTQLIEAKSGRRLWSERYDRVIDDLFAVQDELTEEIVTALDVQLVSGESSRIFRKALRNPQALENFYRGWQALFGSSREEVREAQRCFEEAVRLEPESPLAHALCAWAWWWEAVRRFTPTPEVSLQRAEDFARKAIEMEDSSGLPHLMLAHVHLTRREHDLALAEAERAVLDRPSCEGAFAAKAHVLNYVGRADEAVELAQRAIDLTPVYPPVWPAILAQAYQASGRSAEAVEAADSVLGFEPDNLDAHLVRICASLALGRASDASHSAADVLRVEPSFRVDEYAESQPYRDAADLDLVLDALRSAGLD